MIRTPDGKQIGPVDKDQLDNLATKGRLGFCQIRRENADRWIWAEDFYPDIGSPASSPSAKSTAPGEKAPAGKKARRGDDSRLVTCPDCGRGVSRRADQCPHCGCPASALVGRSDASATTTHTGPAAGADEDVSAGKRSPKHRRRRIALIVGAVLLVVALPLATVAGLMWYVHRRAVRTLDSLIEQVVAPPVAASPEEPSPEEAEKTLSPEEKKECIEEASRATARRVDNLLRQSHLANSLWGNAQQTAELLQSLAEGNLDAIPESSPPGSPSGEATAYQSQYDRLYRECRQYVAGKVPGGPCTPAQVWEVARQWSRQEEAQLEEQLRKQLKME